MFVKQLIFSVYHQRQSRGDDTVLNRHPVRPFFQEIRNQGGNVRLKIEYKKVVKKLSRVFFDFFSFFHFLTKKVYCLYLFIYFPIFFFVAAPSDRNRTTVDGIKFASDFCEKIGTRFSLIFGIICISGGHQDLSPGF